jgi:hypothetical protein
LIARTPLVDAGVGRGMDIDGGCGAGVGGIVGAADIEGIAG